VKRGRHPLISPVAHSWSWSVTRHREEEHSERPLPVTFPVQRRPAITDALPHAGAPPSLELRRLSTEIEPAEEPWSDSEGANASFSFGCESTNWCESCPNLWGLDCPKLQSRQKLSDAFAPLAIRERDESHRYSAAPECWRDRHSAGYREPGHSRPILYLFCRDENESEQAL
jgi:hypothetical protein